MSADERNFRIMFGQRFTFTTYATFYATLRPILAAKRKLSNHLT